MVLVVEVSVCVVDVTVVDVIVVVDTVVVVKVVVVTVGIPGQDVIQWPSSGWCVPSVHALHVPILSLLSV